MSIVLAGLSTTSMLPGQGLDAQALLCTELSNLLSVLNLAQIAQCSLKGQRSTILSANVTPRSQFHHIDWCVRALPWESPMRPPYGPALSLGSLESSNRRPRSFIIDDQQSAQRQQPHERSCTRTRICVPIERGIATASLYGCTLFTVW